MKKPLWFPAPALLLLTLSCGGGGSSSSSGGDPSTAPLISNLSFSPKSTAQGSGGGAVTVTGNFDFIDRDADLSTVTFIRQNADGSAVIGQPTPIPGVAGQNAGRIVAMEVLPTTEKTTIVFVLYVTDARGQQSNRLFGTFQVN